MSNVGMRENAHVVLHRADGTKKVYSAKNLVTTIGLYWYTHQMALDGGGAPTGFTNAEISVTTAQTTPATNSTWAFLTTIPTGGTQAMDSGYPTVNDTDADNPGTVGSNVVTYRSSYGTGDGNGTLIGVGIADTGASGTDPLLMHAAFGASITKTSSDTLKVYVNHTLDNA